VPDLDALDLDAAIAPFHGDAILIADPSPEGAAIADALRMRGFIVIELAPSLLDTRAIAESPRAVVVDIDHVGAIEAVERLREQSVGAPPEVFFLGDPVRAAELGATRASGRAYARPVDVEAVVEAIALIAQLGLERDGLGTAPPPPPSFPPRRRSAPPMGHPSSDAPSSLDEVPSGDAFDVAAMLDDGGGHLARMLPTELSPELAMLLDAAEQRVLAAGHPSSIPASAEELDILLSAEQLAVLDEPIDPDEELGGTGSGVGTAAPPGMKRPTTSESPSLSRGPLDSEVPPRTVVPAVEEVQNPTTSASRRAPASDPASPRPSQPTYIPTLDTFPVTEQIAAISRRSPFPVTEQMAAISRRSPFPTTEQMAVVSQRSPFPTTEQMAAISQRSPFPTTEQLAAVPRLNSFPVTEQMAAVSRRMERDPAPSVRMPAAPPSVAVPSYGAPSVAAKSVVSTAKGLTPISTPMPTPPANARITDLSPTVLLHEGDALRGLGRAVAARVTGSIAVGPESGVRRIVLRDGDVVTAASALEDETLVAFLTARGDLQRDAAARVGAKLAAGGRHAGAALIAHGYLGQDDLWPVLRAHAEWIIGRALLETTGAFELEAEPPGRLKAEPGVFGGAAGAEVLVEAIRRVIPPDAALQRLGGRLARVADGARRALLSECALRREEEEAVRLAPGRTLGEITEGAPPELFNVFYALVALGVLDVLTPVVSIVTASPTEADPLDEEAIRQRVRARMALVEDGDYFALLGVDRSATAYEIRRAYLELRRAFEPARVLTGQTADLAMDVKTIVEVLDEAYEILKEPHRRERYRKAIEAGPP
jgi:hypothetical protein